MALLWTLLLFELLLIQNSEAVDETELANLVNNILNLYKPTHQAYGDTPTFSLALSIPFDQNTNRYDLKQVTDQDKAEDVRAALDNCQVYMGRRVMGAMVLKWPAVKYRCPNAAIPDEWAFVKTLCPNFNTWGELKERQCTNKIDGEIKFKKTSPNGGVDHAEYRVLKRFNHLVDKVNTGELNKKDLMLFYSYKSPCNFRCTNKNNSLNIVKDIKSINIWPDHVFVFTKPFVPGSTTFTEAELETTSRRSLWKLGKAIKGLGKIYRCNLQSDRCMNCASNIGNCVKNQP